MLSSPRMTTPQGNPAGNELEPTTVLQGAPDLSIQIFSDGSAVIDVEDRRVECGAHTLTVLHAFSRPAPFQEVLRSLQSQVHGAQEWVDLTTTILLLYEAGALVDVAKRQPTLRPFKVGFDAAAIHIRMLDDRPRTAGYLAAIEATVRPGDVVIDLGTGTGVLAVAAARAGAERVYAIEASAIGRAARAVFEANGVADRITLVQGWSTQVALPEPADVLVSEIIGNEPLGERVLEATADAIRRHLKPDARFIPRGVRIYGVPVEVPPPAFAEHRFTEESLRRWASWYGIDFGPLYRTAVYPTYYQYFVEPARTREWKRLAEPALLSEIDLTIENQPRIDRTVSATTTAGGTLNGLIVYFDLDLAPGVVLSLHPDTVEPSCSWKQPVWLLKEPFPVRPGEELSIEYAYRASRVPISVRVSRAG